ncbi:hypothetical protein VFPBJ_06087 [Purpureocillium lilacinum]|uniref:Uncharacterized protein n=1 Tax=Purpureocillium lilacinum TaxID=33203 RepID=A0A179GRV9_PURLI|nr:hypothetical protein VFPBJ_06087 [Purpureocillium lilacinum]
MPILFLPYVVASFMGATRTDIGGSINVKYTLLFHVYKMWRASIMKFVTIAILASATAVVADSCNRGGVYCGSSLLRKGNYRNHIIETLKAANQPTDESHIQNSKFDCLDKGDIAYREFCSRGCGGTDTENPDYCL